jgi:hypothetical protein
VKNFSLFTLLFSIGKTEASDHLSLVLVDHTNLLTINAVGWSDYSGEDWSK